jgi:hypothetical protein
LEKSKKIINSPHAIIINLAYIGAFSSLGVPGGWQWGGMDEMMGEPVET